MEESKLITNLTKTMIDDSTSKIEPISDDNQNENNSHSGILDENLETEMELEETNLEAFSWFGVVELKFSFAFHI